MNIIINIPENTCSVFLKPAVAFKAYADLKLILYKQLNTIGNKAYRYFLNIFQIPLVRNSTIIK